MFFLYRLTRHIKARNCYLIRLKCHAGGIMELYEYFYPFAKRMIVTTGIYGGPCSECLSNFINNFKKQTGSTDENIDIEMVNRFIDMEQNECTFAIIFIGIDFNYSYLNCKKITFFIYYLEFKDDLKISRKSKVERLLKALYLFPSSNFYIVQKCVLISLGICFAMMPRRAQSQYNKGINPDRAYQISELMEWMERSLNNDEFSSFYCTLKKFRRYLYSVKIFFLK